jgi:hypothetical protein
MCLVFILNKLIMEICSNYPKDFYLFLTINLKGTVEYMAKQQVMDVRGGEANKT